MNLFIWPSYKNVESFEPESLTVLTYVKIAESPVKVYKTHKAWTFLGYSLPYLEHSLNRCNGMNSIIPYFRKENYGVEYNISDEEFTRMNMISFNIQQDLIPAIKYLMWYDDNHYNKTTRSVLGNVIGLPMCLIWSGVMRYRFNRDVESSRLEFLKQNLKSVKYIDDNGIRTILYDSAKRCITSLEYLLQSPTTGDQSKIFFIGNKPTYIEALVYGHLWPILNFDYGDDKLISHIKQSEYLMHLLQRIHKKYYPGLISYSTNMIDLADDNPNLKSRIKRFLSRNGYSILNCSLFVSVTVTMLVMFSIQYRKNK